MATVYHAFESAVADDPTSAAAGEVLPSHWNAAHTVTVTANNTVLGNITGSNQVVQELTGSDLGTLATFLQAGTGAVSRTVQDKMRERVSVLDYIPTAFHAAILAGTSTDDVTSYVQAAITYILATPGGGTIYFPAGTYYFNNATRLDPGLGNLRFVGEGRDRSILSFYEGTAPSFLAGGRSLFQNTANTVGKGSLEFEDFQVRGTLDTDERRAGNPFYLDYYDSIVFRNCKFYNIAGEAMDIHFAQHFECTGCWFEDIAADMVRARDTNSCIVTNNVMLRCGDDPIAIHTTPGVTVVRERVVINDNVLINTNGSLKVIAARETIISNNICKALIGFSVTYSADEGGSATRSLIVENNIIEDVLVTTSGTAGTANGYINLTFPVARGGTDTDNVVPGEYDSVSGGFIKPWDWGNGNVNVSGDPVPYSAGIRISGNVCRRTLPATAAFSDYGMGERLWQGVYYDPAITEDIFRPAFGVYFSAATFNNLVVSNNIIAHSEWGIAFPTPTTERQYQNVNVRQNIFFDVRTYGVVIGSAAFHVGMVIEGNTFDLDPYRLSSNSNMDGTYDANGTPFGLNLGNCEGIVIARNRFRNCMRAFSSNVPTLLIIEDNIQECSVPVAVNSFNAGNKGIGLPFTGQGQWRIKVIDADPTSATYDEVAADQMLTVSSSMPSAGWYSVGWVVWDSTPSTANHRAGWVRLTTGSSHTLNTDWLEIGTTRGPSSATDHSIARWDGTTGNLLQNTTGATIDDSGNITATSFVGPLTGNAATVTVADAASDTTTFPLLGTSATGSLAPATDSGLTYNASTNALTTTTFIGALQGNADTVTWANEATDTTCFIGFATAASGSLAPKTNTNLTFNSNTGVLTSASAVLTTADINGGTVDGAVIGGASAAAGTFTSLNANGGGALTGTWSNLGTVTTVDINGGTVDGAVIGGSSAAAGTFTTITGNSATLRGGGVISVLAGSDLGANTLTDATTKVARVGVPHYTNSEEPASVFVLQSNSVNNQVQFGGGSGLMNAATLIQFYTGANLTTLAGTERMRIDNNGQILVNDTTNADMTIGLTINQGASDNQILALKSSDVAHGMTGVSETDTFGYLQKFSADDGGLFMDGLADTGATGLRVRGVMVTANTTKSTAGVAAVMVDSALKSTTTVASSGADANMVAFRDNGTTRFILDADGDSHQDVGTAWTNFDHLDDIATLNALAYNVARPTDPIKEKFGEWMAEKREVLEAQKIVRFNADGHHFVNMSKLSMLHTGAIRQLGERLDERDQRIAALEAKLAAIEGKLH
jgi:hypothetical protein